MSPAWTPLRIAWAMLGALALIAGGLGTYVALRQDAPPVAAPAAEGGSLIRLHASPRPLPELAFEDGEGRPRTLQDFRGRTILLNVWATWCAPCREEMPSLDRLQKALGGPPFEVVALSIDAEGVPAVKHFYKEIGITSLAIYVDRAMRAAGQLGTPGVPTTLLIDPQGRELGRHAGPAQWDDPEALRVISGYLPR